MKQNLLILFIATMVLTACQDWMDVKPKSEVDQVDMFSSQDGYQDALNGLYLMLGESDLYGDKLTMSFLDVLAQNYFIPSGHSYIDLAFYNYDTEVSEAVISSVWNKVYNVIANCNNIIEHMDADDPQRFSGNNYNLMKGEALAIRALLHFDLLRLFNAPYVSDPEFLGIPYVKEYKIEVTEQATTTEALGSVIDDLKAAYDLMAEDEVRHETDDNKRYRENRLNYYATAALLARVYLYQKDYENAGAYAAEVIQSERFEWMEPADVLGNRDFVFYREMVMGLYHTKVGEIARSYFEDNMDNDLSQLVCADRSADWYDGDDIRFKYWFETVSTSSGDKRFMMKYNRPKEEKDEAMYQDPVVALIKLPELYLILAECKAQTNLSEGIAVLNEMKTERRTALLDEAADEVAFLQAVAREYEREFYGEGQLFYFYKRMNYPSIVGADGSNISMTDKQYTLPLPADELQFGGRVTN